VCRLYGTGSDGFPDAEWNCLSFPEIRWRSVFGGIYAEAKAKVAADLIPFRGLCGYGGIAAVVGTFSFAPLGNEFHIDSRGGE